MSRHRAHANYKRLNSESVHGAYQIQTSGEKSMDIVRGGGMGVNLLHLTAPLCQGIELMRIIRDSTQNQYMVLIKFRHQLRSLCIL